MSTPDQALLNRALRLLALRDHTRADLARKLARPTQAQRRRALVGGAEGRGGGSADAGDWVEAGSAQAAPETDLAAIDAVLAHLDAQGLLAEQRVVDAVVQARAARLGGRRLQQVLTQRGVSASAARQAVAALADTEQSRAEQVLARKFGSPATDPRGQAAQARFLLNRGFDGDVVRAVLKKNGVGPQ